MVALICTKTNKLVILQKCSSGSGILVRIGVTALPSLAVTSASTPSVIKWNMCTDIICLFHATVSTLAVTTFSPLPHGEEKTTDEKKAENDQPNNDTDDGTRDAFDLRGVSDKGD